MALRINDTLVWYSGVPLVAGLCCIALELMVNFPGSSGTGVSCSRRLKPGDHGRINRIQRRGRYRGLRPGLLGHPRVKRVIVVSNNSRDETVQRALEAGAIVHNEAIQGYGACVSGH